MTTEQLPTLKLSDEQRNQLQQELGTLLKDRMSLKQALQQQGEKATAEKTIPRITRSLRCSRIFP